MSEAGERVIVGALPEPWPPPERHVLLEEEGVGLGVSLLAEVDGRLVLFVSTAAGSRSRAFGPLRVPANSRVILWAHWSAEGLFLRMNGMELSDQEVTAEALGLPAEAPPVPRGPLYPGLAVPEGLARAERLFLETVLDIDEKVTTGDWYSVLRASALLRQLLVDERPVVHAVNRKCRVRLRFRTLDLAPLPGEPDVHWRKLDPSLFPGGVTTDQTLDQFLAAVCLDWKGRRSTVKDLIKACANASGGTHLGPAKEPEEQLLLEFDEVVRVVGEEPSLKALSGVCRVVLVALQPLVQAVSRGGRP